MTASNRLVGTWKLLSMTWRDEASGLETDLWGAGPLGFLIYTPGGRMSATIAAASRPIAAASAGEAPDEEQARLFRTVIAYSGTYRLTGSSVVHHVEVASDPGVTGTDLVRSLHFDGDRLVLTGAPIRTLSERHPKALKLVWERVE